MDNKKFTVGTFIEFLKNFDPNLSFGYIGHYGEFYTMDTYDFSEWETYFQDHSYPRKEEIKFKALAFQAPDVGEYPD
jgi:hypothetical protein